MNLGRLTTGELDLQRIASQYDASDMRRADEDKSNFRQRLLDALEEGIAEDGYPRTTVANIVRRARTSRRTFYEHFDSREACFVALLTEANAEQVRQISAAVDANAPWRSQVRQAIEAWISSGESRSSLMLSWIRDGPSLGAAAHRLQRDAMENFIEMVQALGDTGKFRAAGVGPVSRQRIIMLLGGLRELTAITVEEGGRMSDVTEEAVDASIALLAPR
jgi:AcrR family transcriptional regulator